MLLESSQWNAGGFEMQGCCKPCSANNLSDKRILKEKSNERTQMVKRSSLDFWIAASGLSPTLPPSHPPTLNKTEFNGLLDCSTRAMYKQTMLNAW